MASPTVAAHVVAVCLSERRGIPKHPQPEVRLIEDFGVEGDRHGGSATRQVSLLEQEVLEALRAEGMPVDPGILGENVTTQGLPHALVNVGDRLRIGEAVLLEVTEPRTPCATLTPVDPRLPKALIGRCGLLCRVVSGGLIAPTDPITWHPAGPAG